VQHVLVVIVEAESDQGGAGQEQLAKAPFFHQTVRGSGEETGHTILEVVAFVLCRLRIGP